MKQTLTHLQVLIGCTDEDLAILARNSDHLEPLFGGIIDEFYEALLAYEPTAAVFASGEIPERKASLEFWLKSLCSGKVGETFWHQQWIVGLIHFQRGVSNAFMLAMVSRVQQRVLEGCHGALDEDDAKEVFGAFKRVTDVVAGLIAEGYLQGYVTAVEQVTGMKGSLVDRVAHATVDRLLEEARAEMKHTEPVGLVGGETNGQ